MGVLPVWCDIHDICAHECVLSVYVCAGVFLCHVCDLGDTRVMCVCVCAHVVCARVRVHVCVPGCVVCMLCLLHARTVCVL